MKAYSLRDKLLLLLLALLLACAGVWAVCLAVGVTGTADAVRLLSVAEQSVWGAILLGATGVLLAVAALWVIWAFLIRRSTEKTPVSITIRKGENGSLQISAPALDTMIKQYCKSNTAILSCETEAIPKETGAMLRLHTALSPDADIPTAIAELGDGLRAYLEKACGLTVSGVDVVIVPPNEQKNG